MTHHEQRARELDEQVFQQVERLDVEIVGRFVQCEHVEGAREESRKQEPIALTSRKCSHRRTRAICRKEKVLQVAVYVLAVAAHADEVGAIGNTVEHGPLRIKLIAQLVEVRHLEPGAVTNVSRIWLQLA